MRNTMCLACYLFLFSGYVLLQAQTDLIVYEEGNRYGFMNGEGDTVIQARFRFASEFNDKGIAAVVDDSGWVYINVNGDRLLRPYVFDNGPDYFSEGLARFVADDKIGFFNESGRIVIPAAFEYARPFSGERAAVCIGGRIVQAGEHQQIEGGLWGFVNPIGLWCVPCSYEQVEDFLGDRAKVFQAGKWYYINKEGNRLD